MVIGITGSSGAGKTTVSNMLSFYDYVVLDADNIAKEVVNKSGECKEKIKATFGAETISIIGDVNRTVLAQYAFKNKNTLYKLGEITYPYIIKNIESKIEEITKEKRSVVIDAVALFESGTDRFCNYKVLITAPEDERINRIMKRDNITRASALKRIRAQTNDSDYIDKVDFILGCIGDKDFINKKIGIFLRSIGGDLNI